MKIGRCFQRPSGGTRSFDPVPIFIRKTLQRYIIFLSLNQIETKKAYLLQFSCIIQNKSISIEVFIVSNKIQSPILHLSWSFYPPVYNKGSLILLRLIVTILNLNIQKVRSKTTEKFGVCNIKYMKILGF